MNNIKVSLLLPLAMLVSACAGLQAPYLGSGGLIESDRVQINTLDRSQKQPADAAYHLLVAEFAINRGLTAIAVEHYLIVAKIQDNPAIAERAVRIAVYGENLEAAAQAAQRWIELDPDRIEARQVIASIYIRQNRADDAFLFLDGVIEEERVQDPQLFSSLLGVLAREENVDVVLTVSKKIAQKYQQKTYAQYMHGMLAAQAGKSEEALIYLDKALEKQDIEGAHSARAKVLLKLGRPEDAVVSLHKAVLNRPHDQAMRLTYARLLVDVKEYEKARIEFEKLHQASPNDVDLLYTLGLLSLESDRLDDAEKYMTILVEMDEREGEAQYYLGRIHESRKQLDLAIEWYEKVHVGEYSVDSRLRIADLLSISGRVDEALEHLDAMLKGSQSPGTLVRIYLTKGTILRIDGRYDDAMTVFNTGLNIIPGNTDLLYARALTSEKIGRLDILEADIKAILVTEPDNAHALNALGFTLADQTDRYDEALAYLQKAVELIPDEAAIIDSLGWVHYRLGNYAEAIRLLRLALSTFDDSEIAAHLGEVLWVSGAQDEARQVWQDALRKSPDDALIQDVMRRLMQ